jgi:hypothetical protein
MMELLSALIDPAARPGQPPCDLGFCEANAALYTVAGRQQVQVFSCPEHHGRLMLTLLHRDEAPSPVMEKRAGALRLTRENPAVRAAAARPISRNMTAAVLRNPRRVLGIEAPQQRTPIESEAGEHRAETETQP